MNENDLQVLVVDDSAMVRQVMQAILSADRRILVRAAADPLIAWSKMQKEAPDVVITDLEMRGWTGSPSSTGRSWPKCPRPWSSVRDWRRGH